MICPNCQKKMEVKFDLSETTDENKLYYCPDCKIKYDENRKNNKWDIPEKLLPTEKQRNTIIFINDKLGENFESLTKKQCWEIINKNLDEAKKLQELQNLQNMDMFMINYMN